MTNSYIREKISKNRIPRPFLKWVGGKTQILHTLLDTIPRFGGTYHEPFLGGGALFFQLRPDKAVISDLNEELINCYEMVRDDPEGLINLLSEYIYDKKFYYDMRQKNPLEMSGLHRAARMIYLNKTGFNGLYRVNSKGIFNVPFGRYRNPLICDEANLRGCAVALKTARIECRSFESVLDVAQKGDLVYFDPPYIPLSKSAYFTAYEKGGFGMANQELLSRVFSELDQKGVFVILSNSDVPWIDDAYQPFNIRRIKALRMVNSDSSRRGKVGEVLVTNF